jgi:hypothetical protein
MNFEFRFLIFEWEWTVWSELGWLIPAYPIPIPPLDPQHPQQLGK